MTRGRARRLLCTLGASVALAQSSGPALGTTYEHEDATGDVRVYRLYGDPVDRVENDALEQIADIEQLRVRHGRHRLNLRLETVNLARRAGDRLSAQFDIRTGGRPY